MNTENKNENKVTIYRFDVFKGQKDEAGKVVKKRSVGFAYLREGLSTYTLHLKTFLEDNFYLIQNTRSPSPDFILLTREPSHNPKRKYFWNCVGEGVALDGVNSGIMSISWDMLGSDIYMKLEPMSASEIQDSGPTKATQAA